MGIFGSKQADPRPAVPRGGPPAGSLSVIGAGMTVQGDVATGGIVRVEGTVDGHVAAQGQVLVAKGGMVKGDIETREAIVGGTVTGAITATERVEIQAGATVHGDVITRRIAVAEGATLNGQIRMGEAPARPATERHRSQGVSSTTTVPSLARPSVPIARVAVSPRGASQGTPGNR